MQELCLSTFYCFGDEVGFDQPYSSLGIEKHGFHRDDGPVQKEALLFSWAKLNRKEEIFNTPFGTLEITCPLL